MTAHYATGKYRGKVTSQRFGETTKGTPFFKLTFEPVSCTSDEYAFPDTVYPRDVTLFLSEKALPYSIEKLRALGWEGVKFAELEPSTEGFFDFRNAEIEVACSISDAGYEDWDLITHRNGEVKESDASIAATLDRTYGKELLASQPAKKLPLQGGEFPETITPDEAKKESGGDDIPF